MIRPIKESLSRSLTSLLLGAALILGSTLPNDVRADSENPYSKPDNSWITISGTVKSVRADAFTLDYGDGLVTVEMDDGDRDADGYKLLAGDEVTVSGIVDDDLFESTSIEAATVFVADLGTTFYSSAFDDETFESMAYWDPVPDTGHSVTVRGTVTAVTDESFLLSSGDRRLLVDVDEMPYNPLDDEGYQRIRVGDKVKVSGDVDSELFTARLIVADSVIKLHDRSMPGDIG